MKQNSLDCRSNSVELWRILFTVGVALMHYGYFNGFYIAVDFFFMLSGFLLCSSAEKRPDAPHKVFLGRLSRLLPEYWLAMLLALVADVLFLRSRAPLDANIWLRDRVLEGLLLQTAYPYSSLVNGVTWYISAMVICMPLILWGLCHAKKAFSWVIAPYSAIFIYGYFLTNWNHVDFGMVWLGGRLGINGGLLRGFAAMCLGTIAYRVWEYLRVRTFSKATHHLLAAAEALIFLPIMFYSQYHRQSPLDFVWVALLFCGLIIAFLEKGFLHRIAGTRPIRYLGSISYSVYLNHLLCCTLVSRLGIESARPERLVFVLVIFAVGSVCSFAVRSARKLLSRAN